MTDARFLSGDARADSRFAFAEALAARGDFAGAIDVLTGALELAPDWAAGWYQLGDWCAGADQGKEAELAWRRVLTLDPEDALGAGARLDLLTGQPVSESLPAAFVETLFDQFAPRFDAALTGKLAYRAPQLIGEALDQAGFGRAGWALDLGCGTGLMGEVLRDRCDWLGGIDLSAGMLARAKAKGLYDQLDKADLNTLALDEPRYDLIVAADVFTYVGALERIIAWCAGSLNPGGRLVFAVEAGEAGEAGVILRESRRFAHGRAYLADLLASAGFAGATLTDCVLRQDRGADIAGLIAVAAAPVIGQHREGDGALTEMI
ncbi:methyltransferase domain-containing protein [Hyphomonadaceae bacterium ML37]|nr:methyltransferase domain-containing protein [Hyphomonadaceae bacterium ML37]